MSHWAHEEEAGSTGSSADDQPGPDKIHCCICYAYIGKDTVTTLPCGHEIHHACIYEWMQTRATQCPLCRASLRYKCGCTISKHHLRPGVKILWDELALHCRDCRKMVEQFAAVREAALREVAAQEAFERERAERQATEGDEDESPENLSGEGQRGEEEPQAPQQEERPKHHTFLFKTPLYAPGQLPQSWEYYSMNLRGIALALDSGRHKIVERYIRKRRREARVLRRVRPRINLAITSMIFDELKERWQKLVEDYDAFKGQHEGFIELNEVALARRDRHEAKMRRDLNTLWERYEYVVDELDRGWAIELEQSRGSF
ncbi:hypothetical protein F5Y06DRAFT_294912 [Hypoxylon sp. FL0890]|nr:hypothetical protein F5Y06DRAFT_294912 [Hypoxylon sp. FL0890]